MSLDKKYEKLFLNVTVQAALSSFKFVGKKDKVAADKAAVDMMRSELNKLENFIKILYVVFIRESHDIIVIIYRH